MCGIAGILALSGNRPETDELTRMTDDLAHRGPDGEGQWIEGPIGLGHRRLSIIDLETGHQPMHSTGGRSVISYNGEIYNYRELRESLRETGYVFETGSDTEVILALYESHGIAALKELSGMFAFALWDREEKRLVLARDRFGIKPLYYTESDGRLIFASRIKALRSVASSVGGISPAAVNAYFLRQYIGGENTIFSGVKRVMPGQVIEVDDSRLKASYFWTPSSERPDRRSTVADRASLKEALSASVRRHLVSDVPVGLFLSGGIDSTLLLSLACGVSGRAPDTFTVDFGTESSSKDAGYARLAAKQFGSQHHEIRVGIDECLEALPSIIAHFDQPLADYACLPTLVMSRFARSHVKVVLGGEGADELFGGYKRYRRNLFAETLGPLGLRLHHRVPAPLFKDMRRKELLGDAFVASNDLPSERRIRDDVRRFAASGPVNGALQTDMRSWLPDNLLSKVDGMSMMASLEARVPYLDPEVVDLAFRFRGLDKVRPFRLKKLLRDVAVNEIPEEILNRPKSGFTVPVNKWFQGQLGQQFREIVLGGTAAKSWLNPDAAEKLLSSHQRTGRSGLELWSILVFAWWMELNA